MKEEKNEKRETEADSTSFTLGRKEKVSRGKE